MSTTLSPPTATKLLCHDGAKDTEQHLLLCDVSWQSYLDIGSALQDRPALRLTYDRGRLEFMTTSSQHEIYKKRLSRLVEVLCEEFNQPTVSAGNMTFQKEALARGLEADDCFWLVHEPQMRGKLTWDPDQDPPPDLALEIEISRTVLNRLGIYAALKISEIWCFNGATLRVLRLQSDGNYQEVSESQFFPHIPVGELVRFVSLAETTDNLTTIRQFRAWVREMLGIP